ncbi:MAG: carboxylesterase family protein [Bacteroidales bacterium]|nr:carboxylesterase family protein [Bacteroidales bacterium]
MKRLILFALSFAMLTSCATKTCQQNKTPENPVLTIEGGQVQGVNTDVEGVVVYRGIPFAAPPIGENRWKAPQPVIPWQGVKVCDQFGHPAFQGAHYNGGYTTEWGYGEEKAYSEDCLYLNVWTTASAQPEKKLPVAIWIFGGGMREGWGSEPEFDGQEFAAKDVVLVTFNYRVGPFGFFAHPEISAEDPQHATGNWGTLDQIEAMKWVKKNIAQFGGDPDNVMIFGQSAGARSTKFLTSSPLTKGLFNKAIIMSGSGLMRPDRTDIPAFFRQPPLTLKEAEQQIKEVTDWANLKTLKDLRAASTEEIYALGALYTRVTGKKSCLNSGPITPYIDGYVLTSSYDEACLNNEIANVPYLIGCTLNDPAMMLGQIEDFCINRQENGAKAWAYQFARPLPDDGSHPEDYLKGAFHSSDLWYVFKSLKHCWRPWTKGDWDLSEKMLTIWTNFAKYGDPNGANGGDWKPYTSETKEFMRFKLNAQDAEDSSLGEPLKPEQE